MKIELDLEFGEIAALVAAQQVTVRTGGGSPQNSLSMKLWAQLVPQVPGLDRADLPLQQAVSLVFAETLAYLMDQDTPELATAAVHLQQAMRALDMPV